jgi:hypothetical protein
MREITVLHLLRKSSQVMADVRVNHLSRNVQRYSLVGVVFRRKRTTNPGQGSCRWEAACDRKA